MLCKAQEAANIHQRGDHRIPLCRPQASIYSDLRRNRAITSAWAAITSTDAGSGHDFSAQPKRGDASLLSAGDCTGDSRARHRLSIGRIVINFGCAAFASFTVTVFLKYMII